MIDCLLSDADTKVTSYINSRQERNYNVFVKSQRQRLSTKYLKGDLVFRVQASLAGECWYEGTIRTEGP